MHTFLTVNNILYQPLQNCLVLMMAVQIAARLAGWTFPTRGGKR